MKQPTPKRQKRRELLSGVDKTYTATDNTFMFAIMALMLGHVVKHN